MSDVVSVDVIPASISCAANMVLARSIMVITTICWRKQSGRGFADVGTLILKDEGENGS